MHSETTQPKKTQIKMIIITSVISIIIGSMIGSYGTYSHMNSTHVLLHKTNIGFMVFIKDKIYNLSEMRSMN